MHQDRAKNKWLSGPRRGSRWGRRATINATLIDRLVPGVYLKAIQDVHDHVMRLLNLIESLQQLSHIALEANPALISVARNDDCYPFGIDLSAE